MAVEERSEASLLPLIQKHIQPGTTVVSDCWKAYSNLTRAGYTHETVNHSVEFKNKDSYHTNTIEGHWRHLGASVPSYGRKKEHYVSYFAEFVYRYQHHDDNFFWLSSKMWLGFTTPRMCNRDT